MNYLQIKKFKMELINDLIKFHLIILTRLFQSKLEVEEGILKLINDLHKINLDEVKLNKKIFIDSNKWNISSERTK